MSACVFCNIANKSIKTDLIYEDSWVLAFNDLFPQAPIHILIIPKCHIATVNDILPEHEVIMGRLYTAAALISKEKGIEKDGYRLVMNCNQHGGQAVYHIHLHLLGGKPLSWPPGC